MLWVNVENKYSALVHGYSCRTRSEKFRAVCSLESLRKEVIEVVARPEQHLRSGSQVVGI